MAGGAFTVKPGRTIMEIIRDEIKYRELGDDAHLVPGMQEALRIMTSPYNYPKRDENGDYL